MNIREDNLAESLRSTYWLLEWFHVSAIGEFVSQEWRVIPFISSFPFPSIYIPARAPADSVQIPFL